ncbi:MAG: 1-(5-phosphoribosyl)-5-[Desulfovibrionaceae bacterium]|nr:1-(5-phosphoribosyl)-5-[(5-phosphoribosylamino)methylideneamino]imidazole-4-carboxamide isomerase [Desulfovibrionaceae bacterium]
MILYPAVDIKGGKCVRLRQGEASQETVFGDPVEMALHWEAQGARFLHVIDLDGSFDGEPVNLEVVRAICSRLSIPVQLGGGVRNLATASVYLDAGVTRIIIGTVALEEPDTFRKMCDAYPGRFGVSLDTSNGVIKTRGWVKDSGRTIAEALPGLVEAGAAFLIFTDISLDGMQQGVNVSGIADVCELSSIPVIAAGGVTRLEDVQALYPLGARGLNGIITGRAIYEGTLNFREAQAWLDARN